MLKSKRTLKIEERGNKTCTVCHETLDLSNFELRLTKRTGYGSYLNQCKGCVKKKKQKKYLESEYGISHEEYLDLIANGCEICGEPGAVLADGRTNLCVDHDHDTGEVRGCLCASCNKAIGLLQDKSELALAAASYLQRFNK